MDTNTKFVVAMSLTGMLFMAHLAPEFSLPMAISVMSAALADRIFRQAK